MTDEKLAEEYAEKQNLQNVNPSGIVRCKLADAFLAGLKAGRPQWHKASVELPKEDDVYLIYTTKGYLLGHYEQGSADGETDYTGFPYSDFTEYPSEMTLSEDEVIAWCEIPTFDKE